MKSKCIRVIGVSLLALSCTSVFAETLPNKPLSMEALGVPPNILFLVGENRTMSYGGGGSDVFYSPGYDPKKIYACNESDTILKAKNDSIVKVYINANASFGRVEGIPFFSYGLIGADKSSVNHYTWKRKDTGSYENLGSGLNKTFIHSGACFEPESLYHVLLKTKPTVGLGLTYWPADFDETMLVDDPEDDECAEQEQECVATGADVESTVVERLSGNFLNWYFSNSTAKWANNTETGGISDNLSTNARNFTTTSNVGSSYNRTDPNGGGSGKSTSLGYSGYVGLKRHVTYQQERISVARDTIKKVVRDLGKEIPAADKDKYFDVEHGPVNANVAVAGISTRYSAGQARHVLNLELLKGFTDLTVNNANLKNDRELLLTKVDALNARAAELGDAGKFYLPMGNALLASAKYIFSGWPESTVFESHELEEGASFQQAFSSGSNEAFAKPEFFGDVSNSKNITKENWCQKNAVVFLTDGLANDGPIVLSERKFERNLKANGFWRDYQPIGLNADELAYLDDKSANGQSYEAVGAYHVCEQCEQNFIRIAGALYDHDFLPEVEGKQNIETFIIGFGDGRTYKSESLRLAGKAGGRDNFYAAKNGIEVMEAIDKITTRIASGLTSMTAVSASTIPRSGAISDAVAVQASFDTEYWSGKLLGYTINEDGYLIDTSTGSAHKSSENVTPKWDAGDLLNKQYIIEKEDIVTSVLTRKAYTFNPERGVNGQGVRFGHNCSAESSAFQCLSTKMQRDLDRVAEGSEAERNSLMLYLMGDITNEEGFPKVNATNKYRARGAYRKAANGEIDAVLAGGMLGDIINSSPIFMKEPTRNWRGDPVIIDRQKYQEYYEANKNRTAMIYVGDNRGMLHGFNAVTGQEVFSYIPNLLAQTDDLAFTNKEKSKNSGLAYLAHKEYDHGFYVDIQPTISDVFVDFYSGGINESWRTVLFGGLGAGGKGLFALDITSPDNFSENNVLWEFSASDDSDLGYTFAQPIVGKVNYGIADEQGNEKGRWAVILPNGYHSATGRAVLFIIFVDAKRPDGTWKEGRDYVKLILGDDSNQGNGLSEPVAIDEDGDGLIDFVYAGDLKGNMWSIDLRANVPSVE